MVRAVVMEKSAAEVAFEAAVEAGRSTALLRRSQQSEDVYRLDLGALPARTKLVVRILANSTLSSGAGDACTTKVRGG